MFQYYSAKARLSKKAKTTVPTEEVEPDRISEGANRDADIAIDDPVPQSQDTYVEPPEANPASPHADTPSPARDEDLPSPVRGTANPPSTSKLVMMMLLSPVLLILPLVTRLL